MARFLALAWCKLRLCSANHRAGYFSNLACDWLSIVWAYSKQETENGPKSYKHLKSLATRIYIIISKNIRYLLWNRGAWRFFHDTYLTIEDQGIRCTDHLHDSCPFTDVNQHYNMTVWILAGNYISFTIAAGLIRLHMPGVKKSRV